MKKELKLEDVDNLSYKDIACLILERNSSGINTLELFTKIIKLLELPDSTIEDKIADFYTALATDKRFILIDGSWDLRKRHTSDKLMTSANLEDEDEELEENRDELDVVDDEYEDDYSDEDDLDSDTDYDDTDDDLKDFMVIDEDELSE